MIATNIRAKAPEDIWHFYNGRANVENMIQEAAVGFGMDNSPSHWYAGNMAYFNIGMLAYNLMNQYLDYDTWIQYDYSKQLLCCGGVK